MITGWYHRELKRRKLSSDTEPLPVSVKVLGAGATAGNRTMEVSVCVCGLPSNEQ